MKTLKAHQKSTQKSQLEKNIKRKPVYRASAIFPIYHSSEYSTKILFMGYWMVKRQIKEVGLLLTLRNQNGEIIFRRNEVISQIKAYNYEVGVIGKTYMTELGFSELQGSLELEIFSTRDLVFPYPAFVVCYYNDIFSSVVHTTGRVYNDIEDLKETNEREVEESGFDIVSTKEINPFFSFVNGPLENNSPKIGITLLNKNNTDIHDVVDLPAIKPYESVSINISKLINLSSLNHSRGSVSIKHNFRGFFPRFIAGNIRNTEKKILSITHTYYNCSTCFEESDYRPRKDSNYNDASVLIPIFIIADKFTELVLYPIFSPSSYTLSFDFYTRDGENIFSIDKYKTISKDSKSHEFINFNGLLKNVDRQNEIVSARINTNWIGVRIPTRLKFALNVGQSKNVNFPCNICFAPKLGDPRVDLKPSTFRWLPLLNISKSVAVIYNSSPQKVYKRNAQVNIKIYREKDEKFLEYNEVIQPFGQIKFELFKNDEILDFLNNKSGWLTCKADNPHVNTWYFDFSDSGAVAGDHGF